MSTDHLCDAMTYALATALGRRIPHRDGVLAELTPAQREDLDAALDRHRKRLANE